MGLITLWPRLAFLLTTLFCLGCEQREEPVVTFGALPALRQIHHPQLRDELARLEAERATPVLLDEPETQTHSNEALEEILSHQKLRLVRKRMEELYPQGPFRFDRVDLEMIIRLRKHLDEPLGKYRAILRPGKFQFRVSLMSGLLADLSFLDHAFLVHRLEAVDAAEALFTADRPHETMLHLQRMFQIDTQLAALKHVASRLSAVQLRAETLRVVQAVVKHERCTASLHRRLLRMIDAQLAAWPSDADAWIGDRACGLHAYEMVRHGYVVDVLTKEETRKKKQRGELEVYIDVVTKGVDNDELFYLQAMRQVIAKCEQPFHQRKKTLSEVANELIQLSETPRYPVFAATVLLPNMTMGHRMQARDRARCEAWSIALAYATGETVPPYKVDPVSGQPYQIDRTDHLVQIKQIDEVNGYETVTVPLANRQQFGTKPVGPDFRR